VRYYFVPQSVSKSVSKQDARYNLGMDKLRIETLGGIQIWLDDKQVKISRRKATALLVYLAVTQELHPRDSLANLLWPENDQSRAYANLRQALWDINRSLGDNWLEVTRRTVKLSDSEEVWLDIQIFNQLLSMVKTHAHPHGGVCEQCLSNLQQAAELVQGDFLAGFSLRDSAVFDDWQFFQTDELQRQVGSVYRQLVAWHLEKQDYEQAVGYAQYWLQLDELNEDAHRALMQLYMANNQRNAALRQYQNCVQILKRELGISPESETTELYESIRSGDLQSPPPEPEEETVPSPKSNLPVHITPFVGRNRESLELARLLKDPDIRLLTILAPGGMGKSRLAIEIARKLEALFEHGVFFVPLAPLESPEMILNYIADVIGYTFREGQPANQQLLDYFREKSILLVLDNFEHLLAKTHWISDLLATAPRLKILATSRIPLNIQVENRFHLSGLEFPEKGTREEISSYSAVKLFLQSARRARPTFKPAENDWQHIGEICRLVGGMPLGIEMASAWLEMLSLSEIAQEIHQGLDFFETQISDIPERQHSLGSVFDYSWKMLNEEEHQLLPQLSIFRGGFTRQAAEQIVGISLRQLVGFANRSLLTRTPEDRFEIHELLRQYGLEKLQQNLPTYGEVKTRYAKYYCDKLAAWESDMVGGRQSQAMLEIEADFENIRSSWELAARLQRLDLLENAYHGLILYLNRRVRYEEGVALCELAADLIPADSRDSIRLLSWMKGNVLLFNAAQGITDQNERYFQENAALIKQLEPVQTRAEKKAKAFHYYIEGMSTDFKGNFSVSATPMFEKAISLFRELEEWWWCARIYRNLASSAAWITADLDAAYDYFQEALRISRELNDQYGLAVLLENLGWFAAYAKGDLQMAESYLWEGSQLYLELNDPNSYRHHLYCLEQIANINGRFDEVLELRHKRLQVLENLGDQFRIAELYMLFGEAYHHIGDYAVAEIKGRKGFKFLNQSGSKYHQAWARWFLGLTLIAQQEYEQAYQLLYQSAEINREMESRAHLSSTLAALVRVELANGNIQTAESFLVEGFHTALLSSEPFMMLYVLASAALFFAHRGESTKAIEIYSLVNSWQFVANSQWFADVYQKPLLTLVGSISIEVTPSVRQPKEVLWQMTETLLTEFNRE
jgi:DNA-binding SARP family transcriptional activator